MFGPFRATVLNPYRTRGGAASPRRLRFAPGYHVWAPSRNAVKYFKTLFVGRSRIRKNSGVSVWAEFLRIQLPEYLTALPLTLPSPLLYLRGAGSQPAVGRKPRQVTNLPHGRTAIPARAEYIPAARGMGEGTIEFAASLIEQFKLKTQPLKKAVIATKSTARQSRNQTANGGR